MPAFAGTLKTSQALSAKFTQLTGSQSQWTVPVPCVQPTTFPPRQENFCFGQPWSKFAMTDLGLCGPAEDAGAMAHTSYRWALALFPSPPWAALPAKGGCFPAKGGCFCCAPSTSGLTACFSDHEHIRHLLSPAQSQRHGCPPPRTLASSAGRRRGQSSAGP